MAEKLKARTVKALGPIKHDGQMYQEGESLEVSAQEAATLRAIGAVQDPIADKADAAAAKKSESEAAQ